MDIITKTGEIWSENAIGAVISLIKESDDSIEAERKLTHWLTEMNCQLIAMALARIDTELYQIYKVQGWRVARRDSRTICCRYGELTYTRRLLQKEGKSFYPLDCSWASFFFCFFMDRASIRSIAVGSEGTPRHSG